MTVNAYTKFNEQGDALGFAPGNLTRILDTSNGDKLVDTSFGSPNSGCPQGGPGMGSGGVPSNCEGLGKVLIIQEENVEDAIPNSNGGDIVFKFDHPVDEMMRITLFNAQAGATISWKFVDGWGDSKVVAPMAENEVLPIDFASLKDVSELTVSFPGVGAIASMGICRDPSKTPAPIGEAPPVQTSRPTAVPTSSPAPSASPTTSAPTLSPIERGDCPADVQLLAKVGHTEWPDVPIVILEQSTTTVKFMVINTVVEQISSIFTQFHEAQTGETECFEDENVKRGDYAVYTAYCMKKKPISIVDVWIADDMLDAELDTAVVPECCHPEDAKKLPTVQWTFKLQCVTECPTERRAQEVGDIPKETNDAFDDWQDSKVEKHLSDLPKDGHFCSSKDYPCGDDEGTVHVCHYSARHGYQTFCVPESDSDILLYYPKDYCGPCVGGYAKYG